MSRVYFHSIHDDAELAGAERAYAGGVCTDLFMTSIGSIYPPEEGHHWLVPFLPSNCYVMDFYPGPRPPVNKNHTVPEHRAEQSGWLDKFARFRQSAETYLRIHMGDQGLIFKNSKGESVPVTIFVLHLNSALAMGNDVTKLLARLHGQCEIHCYVEGPNRTWLAGIIERGRKTNVLRPDMGWEDVAELLRSRDDCPVVCSYSVCEPFPNLAMLPEDHWMREKVKNERFSWDEPRFDAVSHEERWEEGMKVLRKMSGEGAKLELKPDDWDDYVFDKGVSGFDVCPSIKDRRGL